MTDAIARWRLILGDAAQDALGPCGASAPVDDALGFLYDRERAQRHGDRAPSRGGTDEAAELTLGRWLDDVHALFPREAAERIERDAIDRYDLIELVTDPAVLERVEASPTLLRAVLRTKHLMAPAVLAAARRLVARVVEDLTARLRPRVATELGGRRRPGSARRVRRNLDLRATVLRNLRGYDPATRRVTIERAYFASRTRRIGERWQLILLVDQSGSMLGSAVHAAVTAACLVGVPSLRCHLATFDTRVVDLSEHMGDPVELLMRVQLGGGTDIARALAYGATLIEDPRRALVVIVSDLYEGGDARALRRRVGELRARGARVLVLAALDEHASPRFDRELARDLAFAGAEVGAMTPARLVEIVSEAVSA